MSDLIKQLGGPAGTVEGRKTTGSFSGPADALISGGHQAGDVASGIADTAAATPDQIAKALVGGVVAALGANGLKIVLTIGLVLGGVVVAGVGTTRLAGARVTPEDVAALGKATGGAKAGAKGAAA